MRLFSRVPRLLCPAGIGLAALAFTSLTPAQTDPGYRLPSAPLVAVVDAPLTPSINVSPDKRFLLLGERPPLPPVAELARPELRLAGMRIDPATNGPSREGYLTGMTLKRIDGGAEARVSGVPAGARMSEVSWAPGGRHFSFTVSTTHGIELWIAEVETAKAHRLTERMLNTLMDEPSWVDAETLVASFVPATWGGARRADGAGRAGHPGKSRREETRTHVSGHAREHLR